MRRVAGVLVVALLLAMCATVESKPDSEETVQGRVVDITDAFVSKATITFWSGTDEYVTNTRDDGTYSIKLKPDTYTLRVSQSGFCTVRRAAFMLRRDAPVRFNLQMWVCPSDTEFVHYIELEGIARTHMKPMILFGTTDSRGVLQRFSGPETSDDGTGKARKYPAILTFNLLTVQAQEIVYDPNEHLFTATGGVVWNNGTKSGASESLKIVLRGIQPKIIR